MHILVVRLSAMGDVAMTAPVIITALKQNPELEITIVSRPLFKSFFKGVDRLNFKGVNTHTEYKGFAGIIQLFKELVRENDFDAVADLHGVLRSTVLRTLFQLKGIKTAAIDKGRVGKRALTRKAKKNLVQQKHSAQRYVDVLKRVGIQLEFKETKLKKYLHFDEVFNELNTYNIAIAPFAQHEGKVYPLSKMERVISALSENDETNIYLYGGGAEEAKALAAIAEKNTRVYSVAEGYSLDQQLALLAQMDVMVSMDSANMHMASLCGVPTISVWGATHPYAGFLGVGQSMGNVIAVKEAGLDCRPCSVFGNKPCFRGDYACMNWIDEQQIIDKIKETHIKN